MKQHGFRLRVGSTTAGAQWPSSRLGRAVWAGRQRAAADGGFTLVELLVVIVILPVIVGALTLAILTVLHQKGSVQNRLADSSSSALTSALYVRDIQGAGKVTTLQSASSPAVCGSGSTFLLGLVSSDGSTSIAYWVTGGSLVREVCSSGSPSPTGSLSVGGVATSPAPSATVCTTTSGSCPSGAWGSGWASTVGVASISLSVSQSAGTSDTQPLPYTLQAAPRSPAAQSGGFPPGHPPFPPLYLIGSGSALDLSMNKDSLSVNGGIFLGSSSSGAVNFGSNNSTISSSTNSFQILNCAATSGASCTNGAVIGNQGGTQPVSTTQTMVDPLGGLPLPPSPSGAGSCSTVGSTTTCQPGVYAAPPTMSGSTVRFQPGSYLFDGTAALTFNGQAVNFGTGTYIFNGGLTVNGGQVTDDAAGALLYIGNSTAPANTGNGTAGVSMTGNNLTVTLAPMSSGTYSGVALFQDRSDSSPVVFGSNQNATFCLGTESAGSCTGTGVVYAPDAVVDVSGNNATFGVGGILAQGLSFGPNQTTLNVG